MATIVQISGVPGSGKTYGLKTLESKETFVIDSDRKGLPFKGWKALYNKENKNYIRESSMTSIVKYLLAINNMPHIKNVAICGVNSIMSDKEMSERKKVGYDDCRIKTSLIAGISLESYKLQRSYETWAIVIA